MDITKKELSELYYNNTNGFVCNKLGVTEVTLLKYVKRAGLDLKGKGQHNKKLNIVG